MVVVTKQMKTVFDLHRVIDVVAENCVVEDRFDHCSS